MYYTFDFRNNYFIFTLKTSNSLHTLNMMFLDQQN